MRALENQPGALFRPRVARDPQRHARGLAKALASAIDVRIERLKDGGFNVWPPTTVDESDDPYAGDHFVHNWHEALEHVQSYAALNHR